MLWIGPAESGAKSFQTVSLADDFIEGLRTCLFRERFGQGDPAQALQLIHLFAGLFIHGHAAALLVSQQVEKIEPEMCIRDSRMQVADDRGTGQPFHQNADHPAGQFDHLFDQSNGADGKEFCFRRLIHLGIFLGYQQNPCLLYTSRCV